MPGAVSTAVRIPAPPAGHAATMARGVLRSGLAERGRHAGCRELYPGQSCPRRVVSAAGRISVFWIDALHSRAVDSRSRARLKGSRYVATSLRSEERRVGKECRAWWLAEE